MEIGIKVWLDLLVARTSFNLSCPGRDTCTVFTGLMVAEILIAAENPVTHL